jgi:hypothetical protein
LKKTGTVVDAGKPGKRFNLLFRGTGIRFGNPPPIAGKPSGPFSFPLLAAAAILIAIAVAAFYPGTRESRPDATAVSPPPPPRHVETKELPTVAVTDNETPEVGKDVPPASVPVPQAQSAAQPPAQAENVPEENGSKVFVRFGIFLSRENAERLVTTLREKEIAASIQERTIPMPAYFIKAGSAPDGETMKKAVVALEKFTVALPGAVEPEYLLVGPIWLKEQALIAVKTIQGLGLKAEMTEERKERVVYRVVSPPFGAKVVAQNQADDWRKRGIVGVIE